MAQYTLQKEKISTKISFRRSENLLENLRAPRIDFILSRQQKCSKWWKFNAIDIFGASSAGTSLVLLFSINNGESSAKTLLILVFRVNQQALNFRRNFSTVPCSVDLIESHKFLSPLMCCR